MLVEQEMHQLHKQVAVAVQAELVAQVVLEVLELQILLQVHL